MPELTNQAIASDILQPKEALDSDGNKIVGTFTIENELMDQDNLIEQIMNELENKVTNNNYTQGFNAGV